VVWFVDRYGGYRGPDTDWFAFHYGRQPVQTDATGKMIAPSARKTSFFISQIQQVNTLFVGEGNLSFALSIAKTPGISVPQKTLE
jgi:hypothetical protein